MPTRKELDSYGKELMEIGGWLMLCYNYHKPMPPGLDGVPDWQCIRDNVVVFAEVKGEGDSYRPSQEKFVKDLNPHLGANIHYQLVKDYSDWNFIVNIRFP